MAFTGAAVHAIQMQTMLRDKLTAEITAIDTAANAVLSSGEDFTSPTVEDADIQLFRDDREGECITVVIVPQAAARPLGEQKHGPGAGQARSDLEHDFVIYVTARSNTGSWGEHGAWYRADRALHGVLACLLKWPKLNATLPFWAECGGWQRLQSEDDADTMAVTFAADVTVRDRARP